MSKTIVYINSSEKLINISEIGYIVNPTLYINKAFTERVEKFFKEIFHPSTMSGIRNVIQKEYLCYWTSNFY